MNEEENKKEINENCLCPFSYCERHGDCEKCQAYHHNRGEETSCGK